MITGLSRIIAMISSVLGTIFYFVGFPTVTIICGILIFIDGFLQTAIDAHHSFIDVIVASIIGIVISLIFDISMLQCIGLCQCVGLIGITVFFYIVSKKSE